MITPEVLNFVREQLATGATAEQVTASLKEGGWTDEEAKEAFKVLAPKKKTDRVAQFIVIAAAFILFISLCLLWFTHEPATSQSAQPPTEQGIVITSTPNPVK